MTYKPDAVRAYFDDFAEQEWNRLETTLQGRTNYAVHRRFLDIYVKPGMRVLDIGAGPGRFAIDLVRSGAKVTVADLSLVQLDIARRRLAERDLLEGVEAFQQLDVLDLSTAVESEYDLVVCFGGVVSYTRERYQDALRGLARVVRPGCVVMVSVISLYGTLRLIGPLDAASALETIDQHLDWQTTLSGEEVVFSRPGTPEFHQPLALFTSGGLTRALEDVGLSVEALAAANPIVPQFAAIPKISESAVASRELEALELALCEYPGLLDAGGHLLAVGRRESA